MTLLEKKALAAWKNKHALHVLLIIDQEGCTKAVAEAQAYHEGVEGLGSRQAPTITPAEPPVINPDKPDLKGGVVK